MEDCRLSSSGQEQILTDRNNFKSAPKSPGIYNVPDKKGASDATDNYRNDLLKQFCNNVSSNGGRYDTAFNVMRQWGQKKKGGGTYTASDIDDAINDVTKDTTDAASQIKYLLCQQADGLVAPPYPKITEESSSGLEFLKQVWANAYTDPQNLIFILLSFALIVAYLYGTYQKTPSLTAWGVLLGMSFIFTILCLVVLFMKRCIPGQNAYYDPEEGEATLGALWSIFGIVLGISLVSLIISSFTSGDISNYAFILGASLPLILALSADTLAALFMPQYFIIAAILLRMIYWNFLGDSGWPVPMTSLWSRIAEWLLVKQFKIRPGVFRYLTGYEISGSVPNKTLFGAFA